ncbi:MULTISPECIES: HAD family acid phosphatase [unclassified Bacillus (in: firmicutes)]|uniref:5' nucleotidase, NT5C type n=1 Tax=unclassified Bacillus (in: firmicutes) TaxID=185979 RepID=UPI0008EF46F7|nr:MULTISPECIES: HAD family acid phosphatase [unclassified Bacillus (in: firmicutes)]SFB09816.1 hypothetical protein SAMN02799634_105297 [Bacillus sp. UNCCL13]SFQ86538.1 hypothetical protein SAMN04488577_2823 [Bacillus sp. cl95]
MKFGFDIDDTLINLREHAFDLYNKKLQQNISLEIYHSLDKVEIHEPFGLSAEEGGKMWNSSLEEIYYTSCPPFAGAVEFLQELIADGHEIYYITARPKEHGERTKEWMKAAGFPVRDDRFYCGMKDGEKVQIIEELELDYYFDDKPAILETLAHLPVKPYVIHQSYNRDFAVVPRIKDWQEFSHQLKIKQR